MFKQADGTWRLDRIIWVIVNYVRLYDEDYKEGVPKDILFKYVRKYTGELLKMHDFETTLDNMRQTGDIGFIDENDEKIIFIPPDAIIMDSYTGFYEEHRREIVRILEELLKNDF